MKRREIECKIRVEKGEVEPLKKRIETLYPLSPPQTVNKVDYYYHQKEKRIRIRKTETQVVVTHKQKEREKEEYEVNKESEFTVSLDQEEALKAFFHSLGYHLYATKSKEGFSYREGELTIELVKVSQLGWFLELEIIGEDVKKALNQLDTIRENLEISHLPLERAYYNDMIKEMERENGI